jgi:PIN domain nuclease of toxin-antitoxin system
VAEAVLDASAVLAHLRGEPGGDRVAALLGNACISAVNLSEVVRKLVDLGADDAAIAAAIRRLPCQVTPFDGALALASGLLRRQTLAQGLSLGDRACLALAAREGLPAVTADRAWSRLDLDVEVVLIR